MGLKDLLKRKSKSRHQADLSQPKDEVRFHNDADDLEDTPLTHLENEMGVEDSSESPSNPVDAIDETNLSEESVDSVSDAFIADSNPTDEPIDPVQDEIESTETKQSVSDKSGGSNKPVSSDLDQSPPVYLEKDNQGVRLQRYSQSIDYWRLRLRPDDLEPFICFWFDRSHDVYHALMEIDCIHLAVDTGNLICTKALTFGYYRKENGKFEVVLGGPDLDTRTWQAAKHSFLNHGGQYINEQRPNLQFTSAFDQYTAIKKQVTLVREYTVLNADHTEYYCIYQAPNEIIAHNFLKQPHNAIKQKNHYLIVQTPDGDYWRDMDRIYQKPYVP